MFWLNVLNEALGFNQGKEAIRKKKMSSPGKLRTICPRNWALGMFGPNFFHGGDKMKIICFSSSKVIPLS